jgi:hypothetical protein
VLVAASAAGGSGGGFQIYETHPTNTAFTAWSSFVAITITGFANVEDPFVVLYGGTYYMYFKDNVSRWVDSATSPTLTGAYSLDITDIASGEGPALFQLSGGNWEYLMNNTPDNAYYYATAGSPAGPWGILGPEVIGPFWTYAIQHGTVVVAPFTGF